MIALGLFALLGYVLSHVFLEDTPGVEAPR